MSDLSLFVSAIITVDDIVHEGKDISVYLKSEKDSFSIIITTPRADFICTMDYDKYRAHLKASGFGKIDPYSYFKILREIITAGKVSIDGEILILIYSPEETLDITISFQMEPIDQQLADQLLQQLNLIRRIKNQMIEQHKLQMDEVAAKLRASEQENHKLLHPEPEKEPVSQVSNFRRKRPTNTYLLFPNMKKRTKARGVKIL